MMKKLLLTLISWGAGIAPRRPFMVNDANDSTIKFRMDAGVPGDVTRTHPASIEPALVGPLGVGGSANIYGTAVINDVGGVRSLGAADTAVTVVWGFTVRAYPTQQRTGGDSASLGGSTPPAAGNPVGVGRSVYIMGRLNDIAAVVKKGDPVFIWCAADSGVHKQGGIEAVGSGGNTASLDANRYQFNGPADAKGNVEICVNV